MSVQDSALPHADTALAHADIDALPYTDTLAHADTALAHTDSALPHTYTLAHGSVLLLGVGGTVVIQHQHRHLLFSRSMATTTRHRHETQQRRNSHHVNDPTECADSGHSGKGCQSRRGQTDNHLNLATIGFITCTRPVKQQRGPIGSTRLHERRPAHLYNRISQRIKRAAEFPRTVTPTRGRLFAISEAINEIPDPRTRENR